jgi:hypothetical protein
MRRILSLVVVALVMAAMMLVMVMPVFAKSFASDTQSPREGRNYGHCRSQSGSAGGGQETAESNPSYHGGKDKGSDAGALCRKNL